MGYVLFIGTLSLLRHCRVLVVACDGCRLWSADLFPLKRWWVRYNLAVGVDIAEELAPVLFGDQRQDLGQDL